MRRGLLLLSLLLLAMLPLAAPGARANAPLAAPVGPGDVYLALGDSLSTGDEAPANNDDPPDGTQDGYPSYLYPALQALKPGLAIKNLGVSGETSSSMRTPGGQLDQALAFIGEQRAAGKVVSPVTLDIGGNDAIDVLLPGSTTTLTASLALYRANLEVILDSLLGALTTNGVRTGDLLLMNYYNPYPGLKQHFFYGPLLRANPDTDLPKYNQIIAEEAAERGLPVFDAYSAFKGREPELIFVNYAYPPVFTPEQAAAVLDYHPREAGHRLLAQGFYATSGYAPVPQYIYLPALAH